MASIAQVCKITGVSRSTLLYYERIGLLRPERNPDNGYRQFSREDIHALVLIRQLQKAGFSLKEADAVMKGHLDPDTMLSRYHDLERKIQDLTTAREVVKSLVVHATGRVPEPARQMNQAREWHADLEKQAGEAHAQWLGRLGFSEKEQLYIRWVTRSLTNSGGYMEDFFLVFERMKRQGPGSRATTLRAFNDIPESRQIKQVLEIGCGKGQSCLALSEASDARITAIDNHQPFLDHLAARVETSGIRDRIRVMNMSMSEMTFSPSSFDLVWSEGSAYFMGFQKALSQWKPLIRPGGYLFVSEAVWLTDEPSTEAADYFRIEYPAMCDADTRETHARELGYDIVSRFILPGRDWADFYDDMEACVAQAVSERGMTDAYESMIREIEIGRSHGDDYGYLCLLLTPKNKGAL